MAPGEHEPVQAPFEQTLWQVSLVTHSPLVLQVWAACPLQFLASGVQLPAQTPAPEQTKGHAEVTAHCPEESQVSEVVPSQRDVPAEQAEGLASGVVVETPVSEVPASDTVGSGLTVTVEPASVPPSEPTVPERVSAPTPLSDPVAGSVETGSFEGSSFEAGPVVVDEPHPEIKTEQTTQTEKRDLFIPLPYDPKGSRSLLSCRIFLGSWCVVGVGYEDGVGRPL